MRPAFVLLLIFAISCSTEPVVEREIASVQFTDQSKSLVSEYRNFLMNLGFKDYVSMLRDSQDEGLYVGKVSKKVVREQIRNYQIFNFARELAIELILSLYEKKDPTNPYFILGKSVDEAEQDLITFTARALALKPIAPKVKGKDFEKLTEEEQTKYLAEYTNQTLKRHLQNFMSDIIEVLYDKDKISDLVETSKNQPEDPRWKPHLARLRKIRRLAAGILRFTYTNGQMGQAPYLGRALAACIQKYAHRENKPRLFYTDLHLRVWTEGLNLSNYIGDQLRIVDKNQRVRNIKIENGDFIYERSIGKEAGEITFGARPAEVNEYFAQRFDLLGSPLGVVLPRDTDEESSVRLNFVQWMRQKISRLGFLEKGLSHVGIAVKNTDPASGISMLWAVDNYPNAGEGGIRITDITSQFAKPGEYLRFAVSRYDPMKFYFFAKKFHERNSNLENAWESDEVDKEKSDEVVDKAFWKATEKQKENIAELFKEPLAPEKAKAWYAKYMQMITDHMINYMLVRGVGFAHGFRNTLGRAYCSATLVISARQATGIDLQSFYDRWHPIVEKAKQKGSPSLDWLDINQRIIAPAGFMWQGELTDESNLAIVQYPHFNEKQRIASTFIGDYKSMNPRLTRQLMSDERFDKLTTIEFTDREIDELFGTFYEAVVGEHRLKKFYKDNPSLGDEYQTHGYVSAAAGMISGH